MIITLRSYTRPFLFYLWYVVYFYVTAFIPNGEVLANYNGIFIGLSAIFAFILAPNLKTPILAIVCFLWLFMFTNSDTMYVVLDSLTILMFLNSIILSIKYSANIEKYNFIKKALVILVCYNLALMLIPSMYKIYDGNFRFIGLLKSSNQSSNAVAVAGIIIWEIQKRINSESKKMLLLNLITLVLMLFVAKTRSLLFFLPYWLYQCYNILNKRAFVLLSICGGIFLSTYMYSSLIEMLRLEEDGSSKTRSFLYFALLDGISNNYFILPHGANAANLYAKRLTGSDAFTAHNDLLRYWYDWGGYYIIILLSGFAAMKKRIKMNLEFWLIFLSIASCGLHNMLFLPIIWIPFTIILNVRNYVRKKVACCCSQI